MPSGEKATPVMMLSWASMVRIGVPHDRVWLLHEATSHSRMVPSHEQEVATAHSLHGRGEPADARPSVGQAFATLVVQAGGQPARPADPEDPPGPVDAEEPTRAFPVLVREVGQCAEPPDPHAIVEVGDDDHLHHQVRSQQVDLAPQVLTLGTDVPALDAEVETLGRLPGAVRR